MRIEIVNYIRIAYYHFTQIVLLNKCDDLVY